MRTEDLRNWAATGQSPGCPITPMLAGICQNQDNETLQRNAEHISKCCSCQQELARLSEPHPQKPSLWKSFVKNSLLGLGFWTVVGIIRSSNGLLDVAFKTGKFAPKPPDHSKDMLDQLEKINQKLDGKR